jgi:hypothetical protein
MEQEKLTKEQIAEAKAKAKQAKAERKAKLKAMTPEEKAEFLAKEREVALAKWEQSEAEHAEKIAKKRADLEASGKGQGWLNFTQLGFFQAIRKWWNKFSHLHPVASKWIYEVGFFFIFSNGVTIWQYLVMTFLPAAFGLELAAVSFKWPAIDLAGILPAGTTLADGTTLYGVIFNELPLLNDANQVVIGGGLGNFLAFEIAVFTAQCINFPLQRNITFRSHGNPWWQAMWYFIGWVAISILVNMVWGVCNIFMMSWKVAPVISNLLKTFITGGLSMFVFFFIFKIIFPSEEKIETPAETPAE